MKLFEPYSFVSSGWVQKSGVSGLGLSMAKRYVEGAGGTIGVESAEGKGSTFFFSIPFPLMHCDPSINRKPSQSFSDSNLALLEKVELSNSLLSSGVTRETTANGMFNTGREEPRAGNNGITQKVTDIAKLDGGSFQRKVLLVEDTRINRIILRKVLQNLNLQCDEAENGQIAVDYYKQGRTYDLILMDKEMPVMDGHEVSIVTNNGCTLILHSLLRLH
jgi:CheY-like chemotaxis protein